MTTALFLQHLANALALGSLYALIAIGYTMVYGILRLINFAHGDLFMLGAYRPLRDSPRISVMISAIGASFLIENVAIVLFGGRPKGVSVPDVLDVRMSLGQVSLQSVSVVIPIFTFAILGVLLWIVHRTKTGMAMRAVATDLDAARLQAIDVNRIISFTFGSGSLLAAFGGILWSYKYPQLNPLMGVMPGLKCFIAAVVGGIGNIQGAVLGGFLLGGIELLAIAFLPTLTGYRDAFAFVLLIVVLLVKPAGLLGSRAAEKV
jgi:branched-chain amino acid transport system permease protein